MDKITESFIKLTEEKRATVDAIANALKKTQFESKTAEAELPNGSKQQVTQSKDTSGKTIYTASRDDKNTMTFTSKKQLLDYLGE